jgi:hypothetical protein
MVVGMGDDPSIGEYEKLLLASKTTARKELVLLHPDRTVPSGSTRPWLKERPWISHHLHVGAFPRRTPSHFFLLVPSRTLTIARRLTIRRASRSRPPSPIYARHARPCGGRRL